VVARRLRDEGVGELLPPLQVEAAQIALLQLLDLLDRDDPLELRPHPAS
jgi:hypothetical protein